MGQLTAMQVRSLREPGRYSDGDGLILQVGRSGTRSWLIRVQANGKRRDIGLGGFGDVSLAEAREEAAKIRKQVRQGLDPVAERKRAREPVPTFREAAKRVHAELQAGWKNGKHQAQWLATLETYVFPRLGNLLINEIEGPIIRDVLAEIWLDKPETARRVRQRIGTVLDWGYVKGWRTAEAPMRSIGRGLPRQPRQDGHFAAMPFVAVPGFLTKLRARTSVGRLALEALILTAVRSAEIRGARWPELNFDAAVWSIAADRMKAGRPHQVPLSPQALDVFRRAQVLRVGASDLVFPGQSLKKPLSDMTLLKILRDTNTDATVHGFRSSFRDWVAEETSYPGEVAEAALAHAVRNKVEAAYRRTDYLAKRRTLMDDWGAYCAGSA